MSQYEIATLVLNGAAATLFLILTPFIREMQKPEKSGPEYWDDFEWLYQGEVGRHPQQNATA